MTWISEFYLSNMLSWKTIVDLKEKWKEYYQLRWFSNRILSNWDWHYLILYIQTWRGNFKKMQFLLQSELTSFQLWKKKPNIHQQRSWSIPCNYEPWCDALLKLIEKWKQHLKISVKQKSGLGELSQRNNAVLLTDVTKEQVAEHFSQQLLEWSHNKKQ